MNSIIIFVGKIISKVLKLFKRGSAFPGQFALNLNKHILSYFKLPTNTIFVTGTAGKGGVTSTLYHMYTNLGYKVACNVKGSNLLNGITTVLLKNSSLTGKVKSDVLIIEVDERYVKEVFRYITPKYLVINNLSRDQLARNGHFDIVFNEINNSIKESTHLILNADDALVCKFSLNKKNKITYFGLKENENSTKINKINTLDLAYCPNCNKKLVYDYFNYGNLGYYNCPNKDYNYPVLDVTGDIKGKVFHINNNLINIKTEAMYEYYNLLAVYSCLTLEFKEKDIIKSFKKLPHNKRFTEFNIGVKGTILLSKNETPLSYNQSIEYIKNTRGNKTVGIGFTKISGRYDLKDLSWLYDINFELLKDKQITKFILIGPFAYDVAVRLKLAGIDPEKFVYCLDHKQIINCIKKNCNDYFYGIFYFDMDYFFKDELEAIK